MIAYVRGTLAEKAPTRAVIEAAGVGYEILIPLSTFDRLPATGAEAKLLTCHVVREDDETLYGFATEAERSLFSKLVSVSGVGPKIAMAALSAATPGDLALAIASGDAKRLASVKGVGKKTAEKICVELRDKVNAIEALAASTAGSARGGASPYVRDAILALTALGFAEDAANKMVADAVASLPDAPDAETLVRRALSGRKG